MADRYIPDPQARRAYENRYESDHTRPYLSPAARRLLDRQTRTSPTQATGAGRLTPRGAPRAGPGRNIDRGRLRIPDAVLADIMRAVDAARAAGDLQLALDIGQALIQLGGGAAFGIPGRRAVPGSDYDWNAFVGGSGRPTSLGFDLSIGVGQDSTTNPYPAPGHEPPLPGEDDNRRTHEPGDRGGETDEYTTILELLDRQHEHERQQQDRSTQPAAGTAGTSANPAAQPPTAGTANNPDLIDPWAGGDEDPGGSSSELIDPWESDVGDPDSEGVGMASAWARSLLPAYIRDRLDTPFRTSVGPSGWQSPEGAASGGASSSAPLPRGASAPSYDPDPNAPGSLARAAALDPWRVRTRPVGAGYGPDPSRLARGLLAMAASVGRGRKPF